MKIALAQINATVGDFENNEKRILAAYQLGARAGADLVVFPELAISGYPPRDLLLRSHFVFENQRVLNNLARECGSTGMLLGYVGKSKKKSGRPVTNSVALLQEGMIKATRDKSLLPTYDVFDEDRYFEPAHQNLPFDFKGNRLGLTVCEDIWNDEDFWKSPRYPINPPLELAKHGANFIFNVSASPWNLGKERMRLEMFGSLSKKTQCPLIYCNLVGGNDELIFDGNSMVFNGQGELIARGRAFEEDFVLADTENDSPMEFQKMPDEESLHRALVLGIRDYLGKCGFHSAVIALSGGIDSSVVASLAVEALGKEQVRGFSLPSPYSSRGSLEDAKHLAINLGIQYDVIPIESAFESVKKELRPIFNGLPEDTTEENIQARLRGLIMMAISNKFGSLLLTTGNKSELAVGYCTLYGDMSGGLAVISDVPKTMVYSLAKWINRDHEIIPASTISKPPSAELRPDQKDEDSLPPYEELDPIIEAYVVEQKSSHEIIEAGHDEATVKRVLRMIDLNEYKRRQAAPGLKVTSRAFGMGRRIPVAQRFSEK